ncbi:Plasmodium exported protein (PHIST), unknown function [Plasmodium ovale]|uniref:Plasmodium RESA N-terminal domain-containing protein n=1 Tax=Plasmodium ovale TaxID=36330 RepID=A0A1D3JDK1_PLAOA|nr:Plasmodium exported protein (PHIST), unknown function [Plasmodium ovale]
MAYGGSRSNLLSSKKSTTSNEKIRKNSSSSCLKNDEEKNAKINFANKVTFLRIFNVIFLVSMFLLAKQDNGVSSDMSLKVAHAKACARKLADTFFRRNIYSENINIDKEEDDNIINNLESLEQSNCEDAFNYISNDLEQGYERPDYDAIKENERRKKKKNYEHAYYDANDSDFLKHISENDIKDKLQNLSENVEVKDMFIIWNYVSGFERMKYINMQKNIIEYCENLASTYNVPRKIKVEEWTAVYYYMKDELFYKERDFHKNLYNVLEQGICPKNIFLEFLNQTRLEWRNFRREISNMCMKRLNSKMKGY